MFNSRAASLELVMTRVDFLMGSPVSGAQSPNAHMSGLASQHHADIFITGVCRQAAERNGFSPRNSLPFALCRRSHHSAKSSR